jgi:hypothetical protein
MDRFVNIYGLENQVVGKRGPIPFRNHTSGLQKDLFNYATN